MFVTPSSSDGTPSSPEIVIAGLEIVIASSDGTPSSPEIVIAGVEIVIASPDGTPSSPEIVVAGLEIVIANLEIVIASPDYERFSPILFQSPPLHLCRFLISVIHGFEFYISCFEFDIPINKSDISGLISIIPIHKLLHLRHETRVSCLKCKSSFFECTSSCLEIMSSSFEWMNGYFVISNKKEGNRGRKGLQPRVFTETKSNLQRRSEGKVPNAKTYLAKDAKKVECL